MSVCYPIWTHKKEKRHSSFMMGKLREWGISFHLYQWKLTIHLWTWYMSTFAFLNSWVFILSPSRSTFMSHLTPLSQFKECIAISLHYMWFLSRWVNASKSFFMPQFVQRMYLLQANSPINLPSYKVGRVWVSFMVVSSLQNQLLFHVSCRWWGKHHGPPLTSLFL